MIKSFIKNRRENSTIRFKWTILTMGVIFLTYTIFSLILLSTFQHVMIKSETIEIEDLSKELNMRFSNHYYPLTTESTVSMLEEPKIKLGAIPAPGYNIEKKEEDISPVSLSKGGLIVKVYDTEEDLIYETDSENFKFSPTETSELFDIRGPFGRALSLVNPIYSKYNKELIGYIQVIQTLEGYHETTSNIKRSIFIIGVVALIFSSIIGWLLINSFVKPLISLTAAMESIQKNLESDVRLNEGNRNDEFSKLARTYNEMVDLMQENIFNQKQFVEDVSHELRTPVAIVEGHLKMLNRWGKEDPQILEESIEASLTETQRMKALVQEMLDLSRVQEIDVYYKEETTEIVNLVKQLVTNFKMLYPNFQFIIDNDLQEDTLIQIYRNHIEQVVVNILDNAVKYSTDRPEVHISLSEGNNQVELAIQDFGSGMSEKDVLKIFNRFYRVDKARSREKGGTGLGLPIVKEIIEGYKGKVSVSSTLNQGSIFRIKIPIAYK